MRNSKTLTTALPTLTPVMAVDVKTGEVLTQEEWVKPVLKLLNYVQTETRKTYQKNHHRLIQETKTFKGSANSYGRTLGYRLDTTKLPKQVLAKSRIQELYLHNLITGVASHSLSPTETKRDPDFPKQVTLGAVDKQMVTLAMDGNELTLSWKVWDREILFIFQIPDYILKYEILKWCLPTVRTDTNGAPVFNFTIQEPYRQKPAGNQRAGIDWGVIKPYTLAVTNRAGNPVAVYNPSRKLASLVSKKRALATQKSQLQQKIERLQAHYPNHAKLPTLTLEKTRVTHKIINLGKTIARLTAHEIAMKLAKHNTNVVRAENLKWVTGTKGSKVGSNHVFQHSRLATAAQHSLARAGVKTVKINAYNTSQSCHKCGNTITHSTGKRTVHCVPCKTGFDRDFNAAINIAKTPLSYRLTGGTSKKRAVKALLPQPAVTPAQSSKPLPIVALTT